MTLLDILDHYGIVTEERGNERWCNCPLHGESEPSFSISPKGDDYVFHCFGCKAGGGSISFISEYEKVSYIEASKIYANLSGETINISPNQELLSEMIDFMRIDSHPYLIGRGISKETIQAHNLGYCDSYDDLLRHFHLDRQSASDMGLWDISRSIIYPYIDYKGCFKFHSRNIDEKIYMKKKSSTYRESLWGLDDVRGDTVYLFEGFHDKMVAWEHDYPAVAMAGTNMFDEYWDELAEREIKHLVFCPDGDLAGIKFLEKLVATFRNDFIIEVISVPTGDPDDAILNGTFKGMKRKSLLEWYIDYKWRNVESISDKIAMVIDIRPYYLRLTDVDKILFKGYFKERFGDNEALDYLYFDVEPNFKLEKIVLANCIYSENIKLDTMHKIDDSYFHSRQNKNIFLFARDNNVTPVMIDKEFNIDFSNYVDLMNANSYIDDLKDIGDKEQLMRVLNEAKNNTSESADEIGSKTIQKLHIISDHNIYIAESKEIVNDVMGVINKRVNDPQVTGIPLDTDRFPLLNKSLLGLVPEKLILVSGPTGHGKTTMVCNMVSPIIFDQDEVVLWFTLEMTNHEMTEKNLAIRTGISGIKILTGSLEQSEYDALAETAKDLRDKNLILVEKVKDLYKIISIAKSLIIRKKVRLVVIDYVQLIKMKTRLDRWEQLMAITGALKTEICEMGVPLIAISQLGKASLKGAVAQSADQSGSYGMLADVDVAMTVRQKKGREVKDGSNFEIYVDKHRYNIDDILIPARFDKGTQRITEVAI